MKKIIIVAAIVCLLAADKKMKANSKKSAVPLYFFANEYKLIKLSATNTLAKKSK